jgi:Transglycosylase-like domain
MTEHVHRHPAASERKRTLVRLVVVFALALVATAIVAAALEAPPAAGQVSDRYERLWNNLSDRNKRWARRTSRCESGGDPRIHGGGGAYHGAFQFHLSTWRNAPKSPGGDPHRKGWRTQAVVAVYLKKRDGARTHWPHCG